MRVVVLTVVLLVVSVAPTGATGGCARSWRTIAQFPRWVTLTSVTERSSADVWAVGEYDRRAGDGHTLLGHPYAWHGLEAWTPTQRYSGHLESVAVGPNGVWAAGWSALEPLLLLYRNEHWSEVPPPPAASRLVEVRVDARGFPLVLSRAGRLYRQAQGRWSDVTQRGASIMAFALARDGSVWAPMRIRGRNAVRRFDGARWQPTSPMPHMDVVALRSIALTSSGAWTSGYSSAGRSVVVHDVAGRWRVVRRAPSADYLFAAGGRVYAGTSRSVFALRDGRWSAIPSPGGSDAAYWSSGEDVYAFPRHDLRRYACR